MSQLRRTPPLTRDKLDPFPKLSWNDFVKIVLEITIRAYQAMYQDRIAKRDWEENMFTYWLERYITDVIFDNDYSIQVKTRHRPPTSKMYEGQQPTIQAKEIDLSLHTWERQHRQKHFVWEAKRIGEKSCNHDYSELATEYIHQAIYRFIKKYYAGDFSDAGVLGYVLAGNIANIVNDINTSMGNIKKNPPLPDSNHLCQVKSINNFEYIYQSQHTRIDDTDINLHHLFFAFEFV